MNKTFKIICIFYATASASDAADAKASHSLTCTLVVPFLRTPLDIMANMK